MRAVSSTSSDYPDDNPKTLSGLAKPALSAVPPIAIFKMGQAMSDGARKYGRFNYRDHAITSSVYYDAIMRHMMAWWDGEDTASDSGVDHLAHVMACCAIALDAASLGKLRDDRKSGKLPDWLVENTTSPVPA